MASINPETAWEFADAIKSVLKLPTTRRRATVQSVDKDGTIWVQLPGSSNVTPIASTGANVAPGDTVLTELRGTSLHITENNSDPAVGTRQAGDIARQTVKPAVDAAKAAQEIAAEAEAVANATNQHFWDDDNGAHVTEVTQDEWTAAAADDFSDLSDAKPYHNLLMNSLGILLRRALYNLVSISKSAIAFYDGLGNQAENIVAEFGRSGARIGVTSGYHTVVEPTGLAILSENGTSAFEFGTDPTPGPTQTITFTAGTGRSFNVGLPIESVTSVTMTDNDGTVTTLGSSDYSFDGSTVTIASSVTVESGYRFAIVFVTSQLPIALVMNRQDGLTYGIGSVSEGLSQASGLFAHAEGHRTVSSGLEAHSEGLDTRASVQGAHAEGIGSVARDFAAHAHGRYTIAASEAQTAIGKYNVEDANDNYALIIGNGTSRTVRSNALAVRWNGLTDVAGETAYPLYIWDSTHVSPESYSGTYPVSPCFVYYQPDNGLYYCEN